MPLTPRFTLSQTPTHVTLTVSLPHVRVGSASVSARGSSVSLACRPYLLRLSLPGEVRDYDLDWGGGVEEGEGRAAFDAGAGSLEVRLAKREPGREFDNLALVSSLVVGTARVARRAKAKAKVRDVGDGSRPRGEDEHAHGFNRAYVDVVDADVVEEFPDLVDFEPELAPGEVGEELRRAAKLERENGEWDPDRVEADEAVAREEDAVLDAALALPVGFDAGGEGAAPPPRIPPPPPPFSFGAGGGVNDATDALAALKLRVAEESPPQTPIFVFGAAAPTPPKPKPEQDQSFFTADERDELASLARRDYPGLLTNERHLAEAWWSVVDVLLSAAHELRTMGGEFTVESAWMVRKLSGTLSWLVAPATGDAALRGFARRAMLYPYLRRWDLVRLALEDVRAMLDRGKMPVVRSLVRVRRAFSRSSTLHLANEMFVDDMCVWVQCVPSDTFTRLVGDFHSAFARVPVGRGEAESWLGFAELQDKSEAAAAAARPRDLGEELD